jgi:hypothetical protein
VNGKFTFKLVYPKSREANAYNIWKQSTNPVTDARVKGYEEVDVHMKWNHWGGLEKSSAGALADGSVNHGNWYYGARRVAPADALSTLISSLQCIH